jgi:hypothetical protein
MNEQPAASSSGRLSGWWLLGAVAAALLAYLLWMEHRSHLLSALPFLILLLCPLLHVFMHRGHGGKRQGSKH